MSGIQDQVQIRQAELGVNAADDLPDISGSQIWYEQADAVGFSPGQAARLAIGDKPQALHGLKNTLARLFSDVDIVVDHTRDRPKRNPRLCGYIDNSHSCVRILFHKLC